MKIHDFFRIIDCVISHEEHQLYAMHSFENDELCFDKSRKDTSFSEYIPIICLIK